MISRVDTDRQENMVSRIFELMHINLWIFKLSPADPPLTSFVAAEAPEVESATFKLELSDSCTTKTTTQTAATPKAAIRTRKSTIVSKSGTHQPTRDN
jgi:hypothetical protein